MTLFTSKCDMCDHESEKVLDGSEELVAHRKIARNVNPVPFCVKCAKIVSKIHTHVHGGLKSQALFNKVKKQIRGMSRVPESMRFLIPSGDI